MISVAMMFVDLELLTYQVRLQLLKIDKMSYFKFTFNIILSLLLFITISCQNESQKADLIITNAIIWTGNEQQPKASSMAIVADSILAIGSDDDIMKFKGTSTKVLDVDKKFITPGFIDTHVHLIDGGFNLLSIQLNTSKSPEDFIDRVAKYTKTVPPGTWIVGGQWNTSEWDNQPTKEWIDKYTPNNPVYLTSQNGHAALANSLAMDIAGITNKTKEIEGGVIERNEINELTGIFKDNAMTLISSQIPPATDEQIDNALKTAMNHFVKNGVTTVHNVWYPAISKGHMEAFERALQSDELFLRIFTLDGLANWEVSAQKVNSHPKNKWLKTNGLKGMFDGALGSHTAAFLEPYSDDPTNSGLFVLPEEDLYHYVSNADKQGLQVAVHAIGDRAINILLNVFEKVQLENGKRDRRFRVEHAQHITPSDIKRFAELNVIASMQPYHAIDDGQWVEKAIGPERIKSTYAFNSLMEAKATVAFGSDWWVAPASPLYGMYAAVTRRTLDGKNPDGWIPEQKITIEQALNAYTKNGAYASFDEDIKGTLTVGKLADFVILDNDITKVAPQQIKDVKVLQTYVGGKKVFDSEEVIEDHNK